MARVCNDCVADEMLCGNCTRNPNNPIYSNYYKPYNPTCKCNHMYCIHDPAYIYYYHSEWYHELYGNMTPEDAAKSTASCVNCHCGECYDDEDK